MSVFTDDRITGLLRAVLAVGLLGLASVAQADYRPVVGVYYLQDQLGTSTSGAGSRNINSNGGLGLVFGLDGGGNDRFSLDVTSFDLGSDSTLDLYNLNYDHFFGLATLPPEIRLFAGAALGYGTLDIKAAYGVSGDKTQNVDFGLRLGGEYRFTPQLAAEIGARYLRTNLTVHLSDSGGPFDFSIKDDLGGWVGINYRF